MAQYYAIKSYEEAILYMENLYLKSNYDKLCKVLLDSPVCDATKISGYIDAMKLHSSLTLFFLVTNNSLYKMLLNKFYDGKLDEKTSDILEQLK